jgi:hypothetical protein
MFHFKKVVTGQVDYFRGLHVARGPRVGHQWYRRSRVSVLMDNEWPIFIDDYIFITFHYSYACAKFQKHKIY